MDKRRKTPDCYEDEYCANFKTPLCSKCERNFENFDIQDNYRYQEPSNANQQTKEKAKE